MVCNSCGDETGVNQLCVSKVSIFNHLTMEEMQEVVQVSYQRKFKKRELIYQAEEPTESLFIVHKGKVKIYRLTETGKEQLVRILNTGEFTGEYALFTETDTTCFAEAVEDTEICVISRKDMYDLILRHPTISLKILEELSTRLNDSEKLLEEVNVQDVESRVASYLIGLVESGQVSGQMEVTLPMSKKDLASFIGTSRESLSRKLSAFQQRGWIAQTGQRNMVIRDLNQLKAAVKE